MSVVKQQAEGYIGNLQKLRRSLSEHASIRAIVPGVLVHRVCGELEAIGSCPIFQSSPATDEACLVQRVSSFWAMSSLQTKRMMTTQKSNV